MQYHIKLFGSDVAYWIFNEHQPTTIVMVHGFRGTHHGLQAIIDELPEFRIIIPDLPGFGESTPMTEYQHDIAGYSASIIQFMRALQLDQPVLLGHSFGSIIAAHIAAYEPQSISKLILINAIATSPLKGPRKLLGKLTSSYYWLGRRLPEGAGHALLASPIITFSTSVIMAKTKDKQLRKAIHKSHLTHFSTFQSRDSLHEAFQASISSTALDYASLITAPTLLIAGEIDDIAPLKGQYVLEKRIANARLVTLPKVGHLIHHETPQQAAQAIKQFLL